MTKVEYRKQIWQLLKEYEADETMPLEEVLDKIMALPTPKDIKNPYGGMATRG